MVREVCETEVAVVALLSEGTIRFASTAGTPEEPLSALEPQFQKTAHGSGLFSAKDVPPPWGFYAGVPVANSSGTILGTLSVADHTPRELTKTQRKTLEVLASQIAQTLQKTNLEELFALQTTHNPIPLAVFDTHMNYLHASRTWVERFNPHQPDPRGLNHYDVNSDIPEHWKDVHRRCLAGNEEKSEEETIPTADGTLRRLRWTVRPWYRFDGKVGGLIIFSEDITENRNYRLIFESAKEAIGVIDIDGSFLDVNRAACEMFGYDREEFLTLEQPDLVVESEVPRFESENERLRSGELTLSEWHCRRKDGSTFTLEVNATILADGNILSVSRDITERKKRERRTELTNRLSKTLVSIDKTLLRLEHRRSFLEKICREAVQEFFNLIWLFLDDGELIVAKEGGSTSKPRCPESLKEELDVLNESHTPITYEADAENRPPWLETLGCQGQAAVILPLESEGKLRGAMGFCTEQLKIFEAEEIRLLGYLAANLSYALEAHNRREERRAEEQRNAAQRNALIALTAYHASRSESAEELFRRLTEASSKTLGVKRVSIWLSVPGTTTWECADHFEADSGKHNSGVTLEFSSRPSYFKALEQAEVIAAEDVRVHPYTREDEAAYYNRYNIGAVLDVPVRLDESRQGLLCHEHVGSPRVWTPDEKTFAVALSHLIALVLEQQQRREAERALQKSEQTLSRSLKMARLGPWEYDVENDIFLFNDHFYETLRTTAEIEGGHQMTPERYAERFLPEEVVPIVREETEKAIRTTDPDYTKLVEHPVYFGDGTVGHMAIRIFIQKDAEGKTVKTYGVNQDITERKRTEEAILRAEHRFRALVEHGTDVIILIDKEMKIQYASPVVTGVEGYTPEELEGQVFLDRVHPEDRELLADALKQSQDKTTEPVLVQWRRRHRNGQWIWIEGVFTNLLDDPIVEAIVANFRDITTRRELEQQLQQSQKLEAIGRLAGGVAHDFNNILTIIQGYGSFLVDQEHADSEVGEAVAEIVQSADRAANLTRQLLAFSRRQVMQSVPLNLNEQISALTKMLLRILGEDVDLELNLDPDSPWLRGDAGMVDQILLNLVVNSREAMPKGGKLTIETGKKTVSEEEAATLVEYQAGPYVFMRVSDTGVGIGPEELPRIFEPFFTTKSAAEGSGLGLSTVFGLVKQHGGAVEVKSKVGRGTTFEIYFPALDAERSAPKPKASTTERPPGGRETVLLVEDEPGVRKLTCTVLNRAGYTVLEASSAEEAVGIFQFRKDDIDLLYTDIVMPGANGLELATELRKEERDLKVLFTSGYSTDVAGQDLALQGGQNFLQKPAGPRDMLKAVRTCLDS